MRLSSLQQIGNIIIITTVLLFVIHDSVITTVSPNWNGVGTFLSLSAVIFTNEHTLLPLDEAFAPFQSSCFLCCIRFKQ